MKYFYVDSFGKICSCVEVFTDCDIPAGAIEWPADMEFSSATDWHYSVTTSEFIKVDCANRPSAFHQFDIHTMKWEYLSEGASQSARAIRDSKLMELDVVVSNPLRWAELSQSKKQKLADYRVELLNVPQQSGFPLDIVWPTAPTA